MTIKNKEDENPRTSWSHTMNMTSWANFGSSWPADETDSRREEIRQAQHQTVVDTDDHVDADGMTSQGQNNYTGLRIDMTGQVLNGTDDEGGDSSFNSDEYLDSVELGVLEEYKKKKKNKNAKENRLAPHPPLSPVMQSSSPQKETGTSTTADEDEARNDTEGVEMSYEQHLQVPQRKTSKQHKFDKFRCWKSPEKMLLVFTIIMIVFLFLAFFTRSGNNMFALE